VFSGVALSFSFNVGCQILSTKDLKSIDERKYLELNYNVDKIERQLSR
jgi:hypothetical protein